MSAPDLDTVRECAAGAWAWVLHQVRRDDRGPWVPVSVPLSEDFPSAPGADRDCLYDGIAGLALALGELQLARRWTADEQVLADGIVSRLEAGDTGGDCSLYVGLAGGMVGVAVLDGSASSSLLGRLESAVTTAGWPSPVFGPPSVPVNDIVMGDAGIVLACAWLGGDRAAELTAVGADALVGSAMPAPFGLSWKMYQGDRDRVMPNYSHGTAGVATALAIAGHRLRRPDLVEAARLGAEHLVNLADVGGDGFRLPIQVPAPDRDMEPYAYGWCHGPTGTANLFGALRLAGVTEVGGRPCSEWVARAAYSVRASGLPARLRPGFWDNDGRCCGTAGVLDATVNQAQDTRDPSRLQFADELAAALVERAIISPHDAGMRYWRFREHRVDPPDQDPGVGWMQGGAGIAAALSRYARVREYGLDAPRLALPDDWWMVTDLT